MATTPADGPVPPSVAIRTVALFEAFKGVVVLLAASGLLALIHRDVRAVAAGFIEHLHLNPASRYPQILLDAAANLHTSRLVWLAVGAVAYAMLRLVEAYGLYGKKAWAEVLAAVNLLVVALMVRALLRRRMASSPLAP